MNQKFSAPSPVWLILLKIIWFFTFIHLVLTATNSDLFYVQSLSHLEVQSGLILLF